MTTTTKTVTVPCGKCAGSGRYYFHTSPTTTGSDICYPCNGRGKITMTAAKHARVEAEKARMAATWETYCAAETARETAEDAAYFEALDLIGSGGIQAAREFFRANRTNRNALAGLIAAMRETDLVEESNAVVRFRNAMR